MYLWIFFLGGAKYRNPKKRRIKKLPDRQGNLKFAFGLSRTQAHKRLVGGLRVLLLVDGRATVRAGLLRSKAGQCSGQQPLLNTYNRASCVANLTSLSLCELFSVIRCLILHASFFRQFLKDKLQSHCVPWHVLLQRSSCDNISSHIGLSYIVRGSDKKRLFCECAILCNLLPLCR